MEFLSDLLADSLLNPVVLVAAIVVIATLLSGLVARVLQVLEDLTLTWDRLRVRISRLSVSRRPFRVGGVGGGGRRSRDRARPLNGPGFAR
ncbi:MAG: hypothetical protein QNM02_00400 [Acidimicrobiia bacterium]|nr:hypothetical protein [Acidimicrobiia bacterium]